MKSILCATALLLTGLTPLAAQQNFPTPKTYPPDDTMLQAIREKTSELRQAVEALAKDSDPLVRADVEVYFKAGEWMLRHKEWYTDKTAQQTLEVLATGLQRAKDLQAKKTPWLETRGKPISLGFRSAIDDTPQPYSLFFPANYDPKKKYRLDVVLHGRDGTLTEVKFLHAKDAAQGGTGTDYFVLEVYGRGNNAYRWAGETDVFEAIANAIARTGGLNGPMDSSIDLQKVVLRGFSMGGAGSWHLGLHHPHLFAVVGPGAGFSTTRGYVSNLPKELPPYIEKCLHIYDAVDYAENAFNVPVVAYSGGKDPQKAAADNIERALKSFTEPHIFTHIVAPDLEHKLPPEWFQKCDDEYRKHIGKKPEFPERVRFVTYTTAYHRASWVEVAGLEEQYRRSVVDAKWTADGINATTQNLRRLILTQPVMALPEKIRIDGQAVKPLDQHEALFEKVDGQWQPQDMEKWLRSAVKRPGLQGPIDDAFRADFAIVPSEKKAWVEAIGSATEARQEQFTKLWDKFFRGQPLKTTAAKARFATVKSQVLFGDPASNPRIAEILPKLPIQWTRDELVVNGVKYDAATHFPALIYPNPDMPGGYIVLNSGHSFGEADLRGTNALLYPRLGDWAVLKLAPTKEQPHAVEVAAAGLFDGNWKFETK